MQVSTVILSALMALNGPTAEESSGKADIEHCRIMLIDEALVSPQEAGILRGLRTEDGTRVKEGDAVKEGQVLGWIDHNRAEMQRRAAKHRLEVATAKAENKTNWEYAQAAMEVAKIEWQMNAWANKEVPGTVPEIEMRRLELTYHRSLWEIRQAEVDLDIAGLEAKVAKTEFDAAEDLVERHKIRSPLSGVVVKLFHHEGEWVQPNNANGDPVFHIVRLDRLRIATYVNIKEFNPAEISDQPVAVDVTYAPRRQKTFPGNVVFVNPVISTQGLYEVWAEVINQEENGHWLLRPGLQATMEIQLKTLELVIE